MMKDHLQSLRQYDIRCSGMKKSLKKWWKVYDIWYIIYSICYIIYRRYNISYVPLFFGGFGGSKTPSSAILGRFWVKWPFSERFLPSPDPPWPPFHFFFTQKDTFGDTIAAYTTKFTRIINLPCGGREEGVWSTLPLIISYTVVLIQNATNYIVGYLAIVLKYLSGLAALTLQVNFSCP